MERKPVDLIVKNAGELLTMKGGGRGKPRTRGELQELGIIKNGALAIGNGIIAGVGTTDDILKSYNAPEEAIIDAEGKVVMPGFVDPHTHLVYGGSREQEWVKKLQGKPYLEILKEGGGILSTVSATRKASGEELIKKAKETLDKMLAHGTTTVESKTGYGLDLATELKCLEVMERLGAEHPVDIVPTFLGAHTVPPEYKDDRRGYINLIINGMLPEIRKRKLAQYCDVFCEEGAFSADETREILEEARKQGFKLKMHADQFTGGAAELAAELKATSADHLDHISEEGIKRMAGAGVIGVLLPGVPFHLMTRRYAPAREMIGKGMAIALATDYNPGSCPCLSMQAMAELACREMRLTPAEALAAATINAAHATGKADEVGSLEIGKRADILIMDVPNHQQIPYWFGTNLVEKVVKNGELVIS